MQVYLCIAFSTTNSIIWRILFTDASFDFSRSLIKFHKNLESGPLEWKRVTWKMLVRWKWSIWACTIILQPFQKACAANILNHSDRPVGYREIICRVSRSWDLKLKWTIFAIISVKIICINFIGKSVLVVGKIKDLQ